MNTKEQLADLLMELSIVSKDQFEDCDERAGELGVSVWKVLNDLDYINKTTMDTLTMAGKGFMPVAAARVTLEKFADPKTRNKPQGDDGRGKSSVKIQKLGASLLSAQKKQKDDESKEPESKSQNKNKPPTIETKERESEPQERHIPHPPTTFKFNEQTADTPVVDRPRIQFPIKRDRGPREDSLSGKEMGKFRFQSILGKGASGVVYLGHHVPLGIPVAIKILSSTLASNPMSVRRFFQEARMAARLNHPNLIRVLDCGELEKFKFIAMEYAEGITAQELIQINGQVEEKRALKIVHAVACGLEAAYEQDVIHRDVKPANIILTKSQQVKLADLGLAKSLKATDSDTNPGSGLGTPLYFAPEQAQDSQGCDHRSDIYALGISLYQMLAGDVPFRAQSLTEIVYKHMNEPIPSIKIKNPDISPETEQIITTMAAKKPSDRYQSYGDLLLALDESIANSDIKNQTQSDTNQGSFVQKVLQSFLGKP